MHFTYHHEGDSPRGRVQRRADRHEQGDTRGQYPRPRDNRFAAQPRPRILPQPQQQETPPPPQEEELPQDVFTENGVQYVKPARPHVPDYMKTAKQDEPLQPQGFDMPVRQADYIARQNPYVVMSEKNTDPAPRVKRRTLLILVIAAAVVFAGVWISQLVFASQTRLVYDEREVQAVIFADKHPFGYRELIEREAYKNNLHPAFVAAIVLNESSFNPYAENAGTGARGLMQMMENTARWVYESIGMGADYSFDQMYLAETNVTYGCWYLAYLSGKFGGDPILVAAAFHSGQTNVINWLNDADYSSDQRTIAMESFPEGNTKAYVQRVLDAFAAYRRLYYEGVNV
ncbi:MAG: lytic transglycosylase domain-containing protein [Clostridiales bacterium]|nr:lytic transglycosylase domain-containing protein [Clostridiales bacterium]